MENFIVSLKQLCSIPSVWIDGSTYILLAVFMFLQNHFSSDDAAKFIAPQTLFIVKGVVGAFSAMFLALKLFRSTAFSDSKTDKETKV